MKLLKRAWLLWAAAMAASSAGMGASQEAVDMIDFKGKLYSSLFSAAEPTFKVAELDRTAYARLSGPMKKRLASYEQRRTAFKSRMREPSRDLEFPLNAMLDKRKGMERGIVALIDSPGIGDLAAQYASEASVFYEWEGMSEGPLSEANYAEEYMKREPKTPLRPYLLVFLLHRYRCAFECLMWEKKTDEAKDAAAKYCTNLELTRKDPDPMFGLIANDLDQQQMNIYVDASYTKGSVHPKCSGHKR